jgi:hypothetical protein
LLVAILQILREQVLNLGDEAIDRFFCKKRGRLNEILMPLTATIGFEYLNDSIFTNK